MFEPIAYDRGVHLRGSPLWLDAERARELCVVTSLVAGLPPRHRRLVASPDLVDALGRAGYRGSTLPAPLGRWVGVGGQQLQLVSMGARPGAVAALIATGSERLLVAGLLRRAPFAWPRAESLVATVPALDHRGGAVEQVVEGLGLFLDQAAADGARAAVAVDGIEIGLALLEALGATGRAVRPTGLLARVASVRRRAGPALCLAGTRLPADCRVAWVDAGLSSLTGRRPRAGSVEATFRLRWYADWAALKRAAGMSGAHRVILVGASARVRDAAARQLEGREVRVVGPAKQLEIEGS